MNVKLLCRNPMSLSLNQLYVIANNGMRDSYQLPLKENLKALE